jgi:uncharacterized RDD family membrane protein YckC
MEPDDPNGTSPASGSLGRRAQMGGALAAFIGVLLLAFGPAATSGISLDPHRLAYLFLGFGVLLLAAGTLARWLFPD